MNFVLGDEFLTAMFIVAFVLCSINIVAHIVYLIYEIKHSKEY